MREYRSAGKRVDSDQENVRLFSMLGAHAGVPRKHIIEDQVLRKIFGGTDPHFNNFPLLKVEVWFVIIDQLLGALWE